ncbi:MAG: LysM peptidoglycan-binding domain-containing protein [Prevotella sp.]|nr:LysM peptidoglycan-binding domain-containing protein [Prevotella sp.]MBP5506740.1 LysM peptidoglycan-binding domain-containing protein [Prevotella sp.]
MVDSTKCPVCGRKDIPDYHRGDVRCPECGSNLRLFRILDSIEQDSKSKSSVWKPVALLGLLAALVFAILFFTKGEAPTADAQRIAQLEDSIASLNERIRGAALPEVSTAKAVSSDNKEQVKAQEKEEAAPAADDGITAPNDLVTIKDGKKIYVVKKGDTLWKISNKLYKGKISDAEIAKMNGRKVTDPLEIGDELVVK